jgi:purine-binding chemotaxis protein CheW
MRTPSGEIDWADVRRRLETAATALDGTGSLAPEQARSVMEARALQLARQPVTPASRAGGPEVAVFALGPERYAIDASLVLEVLRSREVTPVPGATQAVAGLVNRRGSVLTVIDVRVLLEVEATGQASDILVVATPRVELGLLVTEVIGIRQMQGEDVQSAARLAHFRGTNYVRGVTADAVIVLEGEALIDDEGALLAGGRSGESQAPGDVVPE